MPSVVGTTNYPAALDDADSLIRAVNVASSTIGVGGVDSTSATIPVTDTSTFASSGIAWCGTEEISYTGKTGTSLTGCSRHFDGTTAASHAAGDPIYGDPATAARFTVLQNALIAVETLLGAGGVNTLSTSGIVDASRFASIQAAITYAETNNIGTVQIGAGSFTDTGLTITKPLHLMGSGIDRTTLTLDSSVASTVDHIKVLPAATGVLRGVVISDMTLNAGVSGTTGRYAINLDITGGSRQIANFQLERLNIGEHGNWSLNTTAGTYASPLSTPTIFTGTIRDCLIYGGLKFVAAADSLTITDSVITGKNGVWVELMAGAAVFTIDRCNMTCDSMITVESAHHFILTNSYLELLTGHTFSGTNTAMVDLRGTNAQLLHAVIQNNTLNASTIAGIRCVRVHNARYTDIDFNDTNATAEAIRVTTTAVDTVIGEGNVVIGGTLLTDDGGTRTTRRPIGNTYLPLAGGSLTGTLATTGDITETKTSGIPTFTASSQQGAGFAPATFSLQRFGAAAGATPDNEQLGRFLFTARDTGAVLTTRAIVSVTQGLNASGGAPASMSFATAASGAAAVTALTLNSDGSAIFAGLAGTGTRLVQASSAGLLSGSNTLPTSIIFPAGTASAGTWPKLTSGTILTTAEAGAIEYDGAVLQFTDDTAGGRGLVASEQRFKLDADGSTITTIANFFGSTSNIPLVANAYYEIEIELAFLKTTSGTVTWTLTNSAAPTSQDIDFETSPVTGIVAPPGTATMLQGQFLKDATAAKAWTTGALTTAVDHFARIKIKLRNGTGTSLKIQATVSAGTITPRAGSRWICKRVPAANVSAYAA
jgi:hypothetical protein